VSPLGGIRFFLAQATPACLSDGLQLRQAVEGLEESDILQFICKAWEKEILKGSRWIHTSSLWDQTPSIFGIFPYSILSKE